MRAAIARRMSDSKHQAPHFYLETEIDMSAAHALVTRLNEDTATRVTVTALLARAAAVALQAHPKLNAVWTDRGLERVERVNLGIAVALEEGLIAPALIGADSLTVTEIAAALNDLVSRARARRLKALEMTEGTFTLSNLGGFQITRFTAIITPPQVAILATGRTIERAVAVEGQVAVRPVMSATVSADHRAVDGAEVAAFLQTYKSALETEGSLNG